MPTLVLYYPEKDKRWKVELKGDRFTIGRSREVEVSIPHVSVSKRHMIVERRAGRYLYKDLGSRNGVFLNGFRMDQGALDEGDQLRVGSILITFHREKPPSVPESKVATEAPEPAPPPEELFDGTETMAVPLQALPADLEELDGAVDEDPLRANPPGIQEHSPSRADESRGRRGPSQPILWLVVAAGIALGIVLGFAGGGRKGPAAKDGHGEPAVSVTPDRELAPPVSAAELPLGPPAAMEDEETALRLVVRLFLDWVGRPPLSAEIAHVRGLSLEKLWLEVLDQAPPAPEPSLEKLPEAFERLMGRKPKPEEHAALLKAADGDPAHYLFAVGTSRDYASGAHRRLRPERLLSRSLLVDLTGSLPSKGQVEETIQLLKAGKGSRGTLARTLSQGATQPSAGPRAQQTIEAWVREAYVRLILRYPTPGELGKAVAAVKTGSESWQQVLLELTLSEEYLRY